MTALLLAPGIHQSASELASEGTIHALSLFREAPTPASLKRYEDSLAEQSLAGAWVRRVWAELFDAATMRGNPKVIIRPGGWLFQRESLDFVCGRNFVEHWAARSASTPLDAIADLHRQLVARGVALAVVPIPTSATIYPERLRRGVDPLGLPTNPGLPALIGALDAMGVEVIDAGPILRDLKRAGVEVTLARDTHWTPAGMAAVSRAIASRIVRLLDGVPCHPFDRRLVDFQGAGDLYRLLPYWEKAARFEPMNLEVEQVIRSDVGQEARGNGDAPVLLLGDSYTNVFSNGDPDMGRRGGLAEHLAVELGVQVDVIAMPAGGATRARQALARRPEVLEGKRVVVWEWSERDLRFADEWRPIEIPRSTHAVSTSRRQRTELTARVIEVSAVPQNMGYRDCLIVVRYRSLEGASDEDLFVLHPAWVDGVPQAALALRPGDVRRLVLVPMTPHVNLESACWIESVGMSAEPWWALSEEPR
ncbi:MAG: hypothetical protein U0166_03940 [Acidobacteriota bacterium]